MSFCNAIIYACIAYFDNLKQQETNDLSAQLSLSSLKSSYGYPPTHVAGLVPIFASLVPEKSF